MDEIHALARISVARGSGFAALAIFCLMIGLSGTPVVALRSGGIFCLIASFVLIAKAAMAPRRTHKRTELWLMLDKAKRPPEAVAQLIIGGALREVSYTFALYFARAAAATLATSLVLEAMA